MQVNGFIIADTRNIAAGHRNNAAGIQKCAGFIGHVGDKRLFHRHPPFVVIYIIVISHFHRFINRIFLRIFRRFSKAAPKQKPAHRSAEYSEHKPILHAEASVRRIKQCHLPETFSNFPLKKKCGFFATGLTFCEKTTRCLLNYSTGKMKFQKKKSEFSFFNQKSGFQNAYLCF